MIGNPRFWTALILFFIAAALTAGMGVHRKKKTPVFLNIYMVLALSASIALWVIGDVESYRLIEAFNLVNLFCIVIGILTGLSVYLSPLLIILPLLFSFVYKVPLAALIPVDEVVLGELYFYPSNEGEVKAEWKSSESEIFVSMKGEKAGILFVRKSLDPHYFFLKESLYPMAILTESHPVSDLGNADPDWYCALVSGTEYESTLYESSFPAVKYHNTGFFTSYTYSVKKGQILIQRN